MGNKTNNTVIKVLTSEHGKEVIEYWKSLGVNTVDWTGSSNASNEDLDIYYGIINGRFNNYTLGFVTNNNAEIFELPTKETNLEKAERLYFDGVGFRYFGGVGVIVISDGSIYEYQNGDITCKDCLIFHDGVWAEIVLQEQKDEPNKFYPMGEKMMLVSNNNMLWAEAIILGRKNGMFVSWTSAEVVSTTSWSYAKEIPVNPNQSLINFFKSEWDLDMNNEEIEEIINEVKKL